MYFYLYIYLKYTVYVQCIKKDLHKYIIKSMHMIIKHRLNMALPSHVKLYNKQYILHKIAITFKMLLLIYVNCFKSQCNLKLTMNIFIYGHCSQIIIRTSVKY